VEVSRFVASCKRRSQIILDELGLLQAFNGAEFPLADEWDDFGLLRPLRRVFEGHRRLLEELAASAQRHGEVLPSVEQLNRDLEQSVHRDLPVMYSMLREEFIPDNPADRELWHAAAWIKHKRYLRAIALTSWCIIRKVEQSEILRAELESSVSELEQALRDLKWLVWVFVSYAGADRPSVEAVVTRLQQRLVETPVELWCDWLRLSDKAGFFRLSITQHDQAPSGEIRNIIGALGRSDLALAFCSPSFFTVKFVTEEELPLIESRCRRGDMFCVPVMLAPVPEDGRKESPKWGVKAYKRFPLDGQINGPDGLPAPKILERCGQELTACILRTIVDELACVGSSADWLRRYAAEQLWPDASKTPETQERDGRAGISARAERHSGTCNSSTWSDGPLPPGEQ
jgi:hypothetical protein